MSLSSVPASGCRYLSPVGAPPVICLDLGGSPHESPHHLLVEDVTHVFGLRVDLLGIVLGHQLYRLRRQDGTSFFDFKPRVYHVCEMWLFESQRTGAGTTYNVVSEVERCFLQVGAEGLPSLDPRCA